MPRHKKWQVYYVIQAEILSIRNLFGQTSMFRGYVWAILDIIMRYLEVYSI